MQAAKPKILVLGGRGFIGRHAVAALIEQGATLVIGTRRPLSSDNGENQRACFLEEMTSPADWERIVDEFDVILNCVGILRPTRTASYEKIHHLPPKAICSACSRSSTRFVHVSALGLSASDQSEFLTSKRRGEEAIQEIAANWMIARPSLLDGEGGFGAAWLRGVSRLPVFAVPADAKGRIAALTATDLALALARLCLAPERELNLDESRVFELGGERSYNIEAYIRGLRCRYATSRALVIPIPGVMARLCARICDFLRFTPFSFGHWELLRKDNVPLPNRLPELLGRAPVQVIT